MTSYPRNRSVTSQQETLRSLVIPFDQRNRDRSVSVPASSHATPLCFCARLFSSLCTFTIAQETPSYRLLTANESDIFPRLKSPLSHPSLIVLKWWSPKNDFSQIVQNNLSEKSSHAKKWLFSAIYSWDMGFWSSNCFIEFEMFTDHKQLGRKAISLVTTKLSYLALVPEVRNRH